MIQSNPRMQYRLRTLLILLAILPPLLWFGWMRYEAWKAEQDRRAALLRLLFTGQIFTAPIPLDVVRGWENQGPHADLDIPMRAEDFGSDKPTH
jgi:hypothetical protein